MAYHNLRVDDETYNSIKQVAKDDSRSIGREIHFISEQQAKVLSGELVVVNKEEFVKAMRGEYKWVNS